MDRDQILEKLRAMIADSLAVEEASVTPEARLIDDLGADSLDFVDLVFTLEKRFQIKIREGDFEFLSRLDLSSPSVMRDGYLTKETVARLSEGLPALKELDPQRVSPGQLFSLITVDTLCRMVARCL